MKKRIAQDQDGSGGLRGCSRLPARVEKRGYPAGHLPGPVDARADGLRRRDRGQLRYIEPPIPLGSYTAERAAIVASVAAIIAVWRRGIGSVVAYFIRPRPIRYGSGNRKRSDDWRQNLNGQRH